jgi:methyl-accepting chemotaxis protein
MKNIAIGARPGLGFAIVLALLVALSATALTRMDEAGSKTHRLVSTSMKNQRNIAEWRRNIEVNTAINETVYHAPDAAILDVIAARRAAITARSNELQQEIDASLANPGVRSSRPSRKSAWRIWPRAMRCLRPSAWAIRPGSTNSTAPA